MTNNRNPGILGRGPSDDYSATVERLQLMLSRYEKARQIWDHETDALEKKLEQIQTALAPLYTAFTKAGEYVANSTTSHEMPLGNIEIEADGKKIPIELDNTLQGIVELNMTIKMIQDEKQRTQHTYDELLAETAEVRHSLQMIERFNSGEYKHHFQRIANAIYEQDGKPEETKKAQEEAEKAKRELLEMSLYQGKPSMASDWLRREVKNIEIGATKEYLIEKFEKRLNNN